MYIYQLLDLVAAQKWKREQSQIQRVRLFVCFLSSSYLDPTWWCEYENKNQKQIESENQNLINDE